MPGKNGKESSGRVEADGTVDLKTARTLLRGELMKFLKVRRQGLIKGAAHQMEKLDRLEAQCKGLALPVAEGPTRVDADFFDWAKSLALDVPDLYATVQELLGKPDELRKAVREHALEDLDGRLEGWLTDYEAFDPEFADGVCSAAMNRLSRSLSRRY